MQDRRYFPRLNVHRPLRQCAIAHASAADADDQSSKAFIKGGVEKAAVVLDEMLEEIMKELFADSATRYISASDPSEGLTEEEACRSAVVRRIEFLDANFLGALTGYIDMLKKSKGDEGQDGMLSLLEGIRTQVLYQVALRLPPAAGVLNRVLAHEEKDARLAVLREAMEGGKGDIPGSDFESLSAAATQFIDDMEDAEVVIDRRLLARLCLVREEVRWIADERSFTSGETIGLKKERSKDDNGDEDGGEGEEEDGPRPVLRTNVPQRPAAFINQLVSVPDPTMRVALISRAFCEDWDGAAPRQKAQTAAQKDQPDYVRPGRFMAALTLMMSRIEQEGLEEAKRGSLVKRMADIQLEAINILDRMQRGELRNQSSVTNR